MELNKLLNEYYELFDDYFPTFIFADESEKELCKIIKSYIDKGEPYEYMEDAIY